MWSVYLDNNPLRTSATRALGAASRRAYYGPLAPLRARKVTKTALPGRRWVRVRNFMAGISGLDLALVHLRTDPSVGLMALPRPTRTYLGREVVGDVIDVGPDVEFLRVGDRVAYQLDQCCATRDIEPPCRHCAAGNYAICENRNLPGPQPIGGGWGDEMVLHERQLFLVPDGLTDEQAALLEPAAVALHAALRHHPQPEEHVLVVGTGTIGLLTIQAIRVFAPQTNITVLARYPFQVEMATRMGATRMLYVDDSTAAVARITGGRHFSRRLGPELLVGGFDVIYDTVGTSETMSQSLQWVRGRGTIVQAGMRLERMRLDPTPIWDQEVNICGAIGHGSETWPGGAGLASSWAADNGGRVSTFALAAALIRERRLTPQRLITHRFPLRQVRRAVEVARDKAIHHSIKVLLDIRDVAVPDEPLAELPPPEAIDESPRRPHRA